MNSKIPMKDKKIRKFVFKCKVRELTSRLQEEILKERLIKALRIDY